MQTQGPKHLRSAVADARLFGCRSIGTAGGNVPSDTFGRIETGKCLWEFCRLNPDLRSDGRMGEIVDVVALESGDLAAVFPCYPLGWVENDRP